MEILKTYMQEIAEELKIDEMNLKESSLRAPARKHFWVSKLINHKVELNRLKKEKDKKIKEVMKKTEESSPVQVSKVNLEKMIESTDEMKSFNERIHEVESIVEYLEKIEKIYSSLTYDIKNMVKMTEIEQL
jgi:hypothetical protein